MDPTFTAAQTAYQTLLWVSLIALGYAFRQRHQYRLGWRAIGGLVVASTLILAVAMPFAASSPLFAILITVLSVAYLPLLVQGHRTRIVGIAAVLSYPGSVILGTYPAPLVPGIVALPFGYWRPDPLWVPLLREIGNERGATITYQSAICSLLSWVTCLAAVVVALWLRGRRSTTARA